MSRRSISIISRYPAIVALICAAAVSNVFAQNGPAVSPSPNAPSNVGYVVPTAKTRFDRYLKGMFGPTAIAKSVVSAGYSTLRNSPKEWGPTWRGFGKRFGFGMAKSVIKGTVSYGLEESFKLDSNFYKSTNRSFGSKLKNALISPVTARDRSGRRVFGFPRVVGTYTASVIAAEWWYPARYDWKDGMKSGTISLGMSAAFNLVKEFIRK